MANSPPLGISSSAGPCIGAPQPITQPTVRSGPTTAASASVHTPFCRLTTSELSVRYGSIALAQSGMS